MIKFFKVLKFFVANTIWSSKTLTMWERRARESKTFNRENPKHSLEMQEKKAVAGDWKFIYILDTLLEARKWLNVKVVNQVGTRVKIKANKILPSAVLSSGEIFVYHQLLNQTDRKATITLKAVDEYTDKPLIINGDQKFYVTPTTYDDTQEAYVSREGEWSDKMKFIFEWHCATFPRDIVIWYVCCMQGLNKVELLP